MDTVFKLSAPAQQCPATIINLSSHFIQHKHTQVLSKGFKYIPKPRQIDKKDLEQTFQQYSRRIKLQFYWYNKSNKSKASKFPIPSKWTPPEDSIDPKILEELENLQKELGNINLSNKCNSNAKISEVQALNQLKLKKHIIFKPADKGSSIVIQNTQNYIKEANRQLSNPLHYKQIKDQISHQDHSRINKILSKLKNNEYLSKKELEFTQPDPQGRPRTLYFMPKIHKNVVSWPNPLIPPARPIVSDVSSDTYNLSILIDYFLAPFSKIHNSYIKDTPDFLNKIRNTKPPNNCLLITLDVESLYTNIDNNQGLQAISEILRDNPQPNRPDTEFLELIEICLNNNDFHFNGQWFLQIYGTSMGKKFSPHYADIFMAHFENRALSKCHKPPHTYFRYLDDIFIIWTHTREDFQQFFLTFNNHNPSIKFKATIESNAITFLDVTIFKGHNFYTDNILDTKVHFKPTDTHELLHKSSYHPKHTFAGILKSQIIRFHRICNNKTDFESACNTLFPVLHQRGYSRGFTKKVLQDTLFHLEPDTHNNELTVFPCETPQCKFHQYLTPRKQIEYNNTTIKITDEMDCSSKNVIYSIQCTLCRKIYIGQTSNTLRDRFNAHKHTIKNNINKTLANHINSCIRIFKHSHHSLPLSITPICTLPIDEDKDRNTVNLIMKETEIIMKLKTYQPHGINDNKEAQHSIPLTLKYSDNTGTIVNTFKTHHYNIQKQFKTVFRTPILNAHIRNKNITDILVSANLSKHLQNVNTK